MRPALLFGLLPTQTLKTGITWICLRRGQSETQLPIDRPRRRPVDILLIRVHVRSPTFMRVVIYHGLSQPSA